MPLFGYILIFGLLGGFSVMVIWALGWSMQRGDFGRLNQASRMIFDEAEPEGEPTDAFPGQRAAGRDKSTKQGIPQPDTSGDSVEPTSGGGRR